MTGPSDDGQAGVTEADRVTAMQALKIRHPSAERPTYEELPPTAQWDVDGVAAALAAEREKARVPFLAAAVALDGAAITAQSKDHRAFVPGTGAARAKALREAAERIRRAAEEGQQ